MVGRILKVGSTPSRVVSSFLYLSRLSTRSSIKTAIASLRSTPPRSTMCQYVALDSAGRLLTSCACFSRSKRPACPSANARATSSPRSRASRGQTRCSRERMPLMSEYRSSGQMNGLSSAASAKCARRVKRTGADEHAVKVRQPRL